MLFADPGGNCMQVLSRYESVIEKSFYKAIHELQRVQAMRMGQPLLAPIALEINVSDLNEASFSYYAEAIKELRIKTFKKPKISGKII